MIDLSFIDWCVCAAYLAVVFGLAFRSARGQQDNEDYFLGGRNMNWFVVGVSMFATSFSSISFLGLPQRGAYQDFSFYLTILFIPFVITPILWWIFVPMFVRLKVSSGYEYLGRRFGPPAQKIGSGLYCVYAIGWMGTMLYAVALTLQTVMGLNEVQYFWALVGIGAFATLYTVMGGLKAVIWTDFLQAVVMGTAIVAVLFLAVGRIDGGWSGFWATATEHNKFQMFHLNANLLAPENFTGRNTVFTAAAFGLFMYLPGYAVSQNMIQRYVCAGTLARGRGVVVLSAVINTGLGLLFLLVGTALFAFYSQPGGAGLPAAGVEIAKVVARHLRAEVPDQILDLDDDVEPHGAELFYLGGIRNDGRAHAALGLHDVEPGRLQELVPLVHRRKLDPGLHGGLLRGDRSRRHRRQCECAQDSGEHDGSAVHPHS